MGLLLGGRSVYWWGDMITKGGRLRKLGGGGKHSESFAVTRGKEQIHQVILLLPTFISRQFHGNPLPLTLTVTTTIFNFFCLSLTLTPLSLYGKPLG